MAYQIEQIAVRDLKPWASNARTHSRKQIRQIAESIGTFGFTNPVLIDRDNTILAGHGRMEAAKAHLDCLAFNANTGQLYVFECKRGHGAFDGDKIRAIDQRLDKVKASIGTHVASKGWKSSSTGVFILSFYGAKWNSAYPIHDKNNVASLFEPCIGRFVNEYMQHLETTVSNAFSAELRDSVNIPVGESIFDSIVQDRVKPWPDVLFTEDGADFVSPNQNL